MSILFAKILFEKLSRFCLTYSKCLSIMISAVKTKHFTLFVELQAAEELCCITHFNNHQLEQRGIKMAKNLEISFLLDFYGEMLTQKQHDFLIYYYDEDLSLSEIAENEGITRQGVRDAIKRAENQLFDMENRLGLAKRFNEVKQGLAEIKECAEEISDYNLNHTLSKEISSNAAKIKALADMLGE